MFTYFLFLITFILFPALSFEFSKRIAGKVSFKVVAIAGVLFIFHNICFSFGISLIGDYIDYIIFSLEYLFISLIICTLIRKKNIALKIVGVLGFCGLILGFLMGLAGILLFLVISQDYEADKVYSIESNGKHYQTRRYSYGFATLENITYTFYTYRRYPFVPIEYKIDTTQIIDTKGEVSPESEHFKITINPDTIIFSSGSDEKLSKPLI